MKTFFITGAGSGMGQASAQHAIARGDFVIASSLATAEMESLGNHENLHVIECDVGDDTSVERAFTDVDAILAGRPLDFIINCAGIAPSGAIEVAPISLLTHTLNINTVGSARMLKYGLPRLRGHNGRIILFASLWGKVGGPMLSAYCASKHAVEALVDSARRETHGQDVDIILIEPGVVRTKMVAGSVTESRQGAEQLPDEHQRLYAGLYTKFARLLDRESTGGVSVEQAATIIEKAAFAAKPKTRYTIGKDAKAVIALSHILPDRAFDTVFRKMMDRR